MRPALRRVILLHRGETPVKVFGVVSRTMKNNILVAYTGKGDRIRIFADSVDLTVSFYDLQRVLQLIEADLPPPCPTIPTM